MPDNHPPTGIHSPTEDDKLHFDSTVDIVAQRIKANKNNERGFTVGIFGDWGTGKSSFLLQLQEELGKHENQDYTFVRFPAWRFHGTANPDIALVNAMFAEQYTLVAAIWDGFLQFIKSRAHAVKGKVKASLSVPWVGKVEVEMEGDAGKVAEAKAAIRDQQEKERRGTMIEPYFFLHEALHNTFSKLEDQPCVVFVEDLDRCMDEDAIFILEAMKRILDVPNCTFVIAADRRKVKEAIKNQRSEADADAYFRKFIDLPVSLPCMKKDARFLNDFLTEHLGLSWRLP